MYQDILSQVEQIITQYRQRFDGQQINNPSAPGLTPETWTRIKAKLASQLNDYIWLAKKETAFNDFTRLSCCLLKLPALRQSYQAKSINTTIFYDTLADLFLRIDTAAIGLSTADFAWISRIFKMTIFKLDQLQFEMANINLTTDGYQLDLEDNCHQFLPPNTPVLSVHIMAGSDIAPERSRRAIMQAKRFFATHFPEFDYRCFCCYSWLLYTGLAIILPLDSKIIQFQRLFTILAQSDSPDMARERIFAIPHQPESKLKRETSLQRQARAYPGAMGVAMGIISP